MSSSSQIFLCGFMGAGKSTLLRRLGPVSGVGFFDLDDLVLKNLGEKKVEDAVGKWGWALFRKNEAKVIEEKLESCDSYVLALGGGSLSFDLVKKINEKATLVWLATPLEVCLERVFLENKIFPNKRPLLQKGETFLTNLHRERIGLYQEAKFHLSLSNQELIQSYVDLLDFIKN